MYVVHRGNVSRFNDVAFGAVAANLNVPFYTPSTFVRASSCAGADHLAPRARTITAASPSAKALLMPVILPDPVRYF
jgi:hypothetical protein